MGGVEAPPAWLQDHPCRPSPADAAYRTPEGLLAQPAGLLIDRVHRPPPDRPQRDRAIRQAVSRYATARFRDGVMLQADGARLPATAEVAALVGHAFWDRLTVIAAPAHLLCRRRMLATTVDLLVRFDDGGLGVALVQTSPAEQQNAEGLTAEIGAAVAMLNDQRQEVSKAFLLWITGGRVRIEMVDPWEGLRAWVDVVGVVGVKP
jgi:hypothetical protein